MAPFVKKQTDDGIYRIREKKNVGVAEYVIIGDDKAMLIDTGYGHNGLREFVEQNVTDLPLVVVNSHYHPDHSADNQYFGKVHIGGADIPIDGKSDFSQLMKKIGDGFAPAGKLLNFLFPPFDDSKVEYVPFEDGEIFDLGGRTVTVHDFPGHTRGSVLFEESKTHGLFTNDSVNNSTWLFTNPTLNLKDYTERVCDLKKRFPDVKKVYFSHIYKELTTDFFDEYGEFLKRVGKSFRISIPFKGLSSPLCIVFGKTKHFGIVCTFIFKNQIQ